MAFAGPKRALLGRHTFNPYTDFLAGANGILVTGQQPTVYYPSGIGPYYQDQAGTAALLDGDPVGLLPEGSQQAALGAELAGNNIGSAPWSAPSSGSVVGGTWTTGVAATLALSTVLVVGATYKVDITSSAASGTFSLNSFGIGNYVNNINNGFMGFIKATSTKLQILTNVAGSYSVTMFSVKPVAGFPFLQTTSGARPTIRNVNGKWRLRGDGIDDGMFGSLVPGSAITLIVAMAPDMTQSGVDVAFGEGSWGSDCYLGVSNGVVAGAWGSLTTATIKASAAIDIRGSTAVAALRADATTVALSVLYQDQRLLTDSWSASGVGSTIYQLAFLAANITGSLSAFFQGDALAMAVQAVRSDAVTYAAMRYLMNRFV